MKLVIAIVVIAIVCASDMSCDCLTCECLREMQEVEQALQMRRKMRNGGDVVAVHAVTVGMAYANIGTGHMHLNEYVKAVAYFEAQHALATSLKLAHGQSQAALNMGVALTLCLRTARQGPVAGADQAPGPSRA